MMNIRKGIRQYGTASISHVKLTNKLGVAGCTQLINSDWLNFEDQIKKNK